MANTLDPALTKKTFNNWLKGALAVLFAREGLTTFVQDEFSDFQRDLLHSIFTQNGIPSGTTCSSCTTANLLKCPTQEFCDKTRKCKLHDPNVPNKKPNQMCPKNICQDLKNAIINHHRYRVPSWQITDATRWCFDAFQIAKCYLPPKGYENKSSFDEIDFNGTLGVIINNTRFQNQMTTHINICSKIRDMINENIRHSASYELSDAQLARCIDALRDLLQDSKFLLHDQHAQHAVHKLNQLQNNVLQITLGDITKILDDDISKRISKQQQEAIQSILDHLAKVQEASVASLEEIMDAKDKAIKAIREVAELQINTVKQVVAETDDVLYKGIKEELITYYREHESMIPAAPLVDELKVPIDALYVPTPLISYEKAYNFGLDKNTQRGNKHSENNAHKNQATTVSQLFLSDKNVRYKMIYITADAGLGKTSLSQKLTITWCQAHSPLESLKEQYEGDELAAMKYFDFLFLLHLRDYQSDPLCNIDDLIMQMLSNNLSRNTLYTKEFLQKLLHEKKCLILLDGLDEWTHPEKCRKTPAVPHNNHPNSCTVVTTSRPWKQATIGLSDHDIDRHIEISALDDETRTQIETNIARILDERNLNLAGKNIADFDQEVGSVEIGEIIFIPYILLQLINLFFSGLSIGKSKCELYSNITELTLERGQNKTNLPDIHVKSNDNSAVPNCIKENETCNRYIDLILKLGKLAFFTLFGEKKESSLIFERRIITQYMIDQEIEFCLKVGLLCQTKDSSIIAVRRYKVFFQHKSVQEFFCAIYITTEWENEVVKLTILKVCSSIESILEMSNLFVFVCGMNPVVYTCISNELQKIVDRDSVTIRYRTEMYTDYDDRKTITSYQLMQVQCFQESVTNGNECRLIHLHDILLNDYSLTENDLTALNTIIHFNKSNVKSLQLSYPDEKTAAFMQTLNPRVFISLETLGVYSDEEPIWLPDILTASARTLKCLTLSPEDSSLPYISVTALTGLTCLESLYLHKVTLIHSNLERLYAYISMTTTLTQLRLHNIHCLDHKYQYRDCVVTLNLHRNDLKTIDLSFIPCSVLHVNSTCLEKFMFRPQGEKMTVGASASLWEDLRGANVLSSLTINDMTSCQELIEIIPTLTMLRDLKLAGIDMSDETLRFSSAMAMLKRLELWSVTISSAAWRELFLSIGRLPQLHDFMLGCIDMGNGIPRFTRTTTKLERVALYKVTMSSAAWKHLFLSVGELPQGITVNLSEITATSHDWRELLLSVGRLPQSVTIKLVSCTGPPEEVWKTIVDEIKSTPRLSLIQDLCISSYGFACLTLTKGSITNRV